LVRSSVFCDELPEPDVPPVDAVVVGVVDAALVEVVVLVEDVWLASSLANVASAEASVA
jgi:hypothetical protein